MRRITYGRHQTFSLWLKKKGITGLKYFVLVSSRIGIDYLNNSVGELEPEYITLESNGTFNDDQSTYLLKIDSNNGASSRQLYS